MVDWLEFNVPFQHKYGYIEHYKIDQYNVNRVITGSIASSAKRRYLS